MIADPASRQPWRLSPRSRRWLDRWIVGLLLLPVLVYPLAGFAREWMVLAIAQVVPLLWRRRHSVAVYVAVATASAVQVLLIDEPLHSQLAYPVALYSVARFSSAMPAGVALAVALVAAATASTDWLIGFDATVKPSTFTPYFLTMAGIVVTAWALGTQGRTRMAYVDALLERGERIEREAAQQVALAASAERARIAREMHDVVAHGLTVMVVQADGARYAAEQQPDVAAAALADISAAGREALTEMRRLLGLLRAEETGTAPQPRLSDIATLVAEEQVESDLDGLDRPVPDGLALTAYRVVQEALTNVRKHAGPGAVTRVRVHVDHDIDIVVEDDGRGASSLDDGRGLGLLGMRERVLVHEGTVEAGPRPNGGFRVQARLPL